MPDDNKSLLSAIDEIVGSLKNDLAKHRAAMDSRCDALEKKLDAKKKADEDGADPEAATRVAADSVSRAEFNQMQQRVNDVVVKQLSRPQVDRDAMADLQAKADVAYRSLGDGSAPAPLQGEDTVSYAIRLHRPLLKHSKKFKNAELAVLAGDRSTFNAVLDSVRCDAYEAGLSPVGMQPHVYREIRKEGPGGHKLTEFVGAQTIFKTLSRPVKHVTFIGADDRYGRVGGGQVYAKGGEIVSRQ